MEKAKKGDTAMSEDVSTDSAGSETDDEDADADRERLQSNATRANGKSFDRLRGINPARETAGKNSSDQAAARHTSSGGGTEPNTHEGQPSIAKPATRREVHAQLTKNVNHPADVRLVRLPSPGAENPFLASTGSVLRERLVTASFDGRLCLWELSASVRRKAGYVPQEDDFDRQRDKNGSL